MRYCNFTPLKNASRPQKLGVHHKPLRMPCS